MILWQKSIQIKKTVCNRGDTILRHGGLYTDIIKKLIESQYKLPNECCKFEVWKILQIDANIVRIFVFNLDLLNFSFGKFSFVDDGGWGSGHFSCPSVILQGILHG